MLTATARKHVVRALREALGIRESHARDILLTIRNDNALRMVEGRDLRTVKALVMNESRRAGLYLDEGQGYEATGVELSLTAADMERWSAMSLEEAYAIGADIHTNRGPVMRAADDRLAAEMAEAASLEDVSAYNDALAANDDECRCGCMDLLPDEEMDRVFGPIPENREWKWVDGTVTAVDAEDDHVLAMVRLADGTSQAMTMIPVFGDAEDLAAYAQTKVGKPARLSVGRLNAFDTAHPAGIDRTLPLLDMIVPESEVAGLVRGLARAA